MTTTIAIEGIDKLGKTTQVKLLVANLKEYGFNVLTHKFPSKELMSIFMRSTPQMRVLIEAVEMRTINRMLLKEKPDFIIYDRFILSTAMYQCYGNDVDIDLLLNFTGDECRVDANWVFVGDKLDNFDEFEKEFGDDGYFDKVQLGYLKSIEQGAGVKVDINGKSVEQLSEELVKKALGLYYNKVTKN